MAAISLLTGRTAQLVHDISPVIIPTVAASAVTAGVFGKLGLTGATAMSSSTEADGLILKTCGAGDGTSLLMFGKVTGYDLAGLSVGAFVYALQSDGTLNDSATSAVKVGKVIPSSNEPSGKALLVNCFEAAL